MSVDYKDTLNLPSTAFPMKANLAQREPEILKYWNSIKLYQQLKKENQRPIFIVADGPPFANGAIHIGHAVNKILKDFIIKAKTLSGFYVPFIPGWDCHGLPIELNVEKQIGKPGVKVDAKTFRSKCREYVLKQVELQRTAFVRLGVLGDFDHPYLTMDFQYEADIVRSLAKIIENGHLHRGYKPVHWCVECASALAEAEVEYQDKTSFSINVGFPLVDERLFSVFVIPSDKKDVLSKAFQESAISIVIWTTTPWTLPANEAVAVHPEFIYALILAEQKYYIVAAELVDAFVAQIGSGKHQIIATCTGAALEGLLLQHPFYNKKVPIILGEHVTLESGTGCVHTAPAHGQEDYVVCEKYQLPFENPVGSDGCYTARTPLFAGEHVFKANDKILLLLKEQGHLLLVSKIQHSYPHCWRHKTPLIFRATPQWFVSMEQKGLRKAALQAIHTVQWIPGWGEARIEGMIAERPDWCISRQRTWGVPMGLLVHRETGELHPKTIELLEEIAKRMEQEGIEAWFKLSVEELLKEEAKDYEKTLDTLDVWFDSGVSHYCVLEKRKGTKFPANLYLEGSDQHRGWFHSSLLTAVAMKNKAPYQQVLTHGFTVDAKGRKMSKSLGNVVAPDKVVNALGADVLRLWVAATDYRAEMVVSDEILKQTSDIYRRIRNTARFLLANLNGFDPEAHFVQPSQMLALDCFIVNRAHQVQNEVIRNYHEYQFHLIYQNIHHFCAIDLGSFYLDVIKDRQYTGKKEGLPRRSAQTAMYIIAECLVRWMAPILSFTAEEIWQHLPGRKEKSVFLSQWYDNWMLLDPHEMVDAAFWQAVLSIRDEVNKALEVARAAEIIGSGLEAEVNLYCDAKNFQLLSKLKDELRFVLITSKATLHMETERPATAERTNIPGLWVTVLASEYPKCERCWHHTRDVGQNPQYPGICSRCVENVAGTGEERCYA